MVAAAVDAIREHGAGVSVAQIAGAAGITKPVLYRHFADRADLQRAVSEHAADMLMQRIYPVLAIDAEPIEHVAAVIDAYLGMIEEEPQLYRFVVANPTEPVPGAEIAQDVRGQIGALLTTLFGSGCAPRAATPAAPRRGRTGSSGWSRPRASGGWSAGR